MAKVLLVRPSLGAYYRGVLVRVAVTTSPPLNLAILAAVLEARRHEVAILDLEARPMDEIGHVVRDFGPDWVGFTFRSPQAADVREMALRVLQVRPQARLVAGGPHASVMPGATVATGPFHFAIQGEGENALAALIEGEAPPAIPGLHWKGGSTAPSSPVADLDSHPLPAWHLFDLRHYRRPSLVGPWVPVADLETSRGCPGSCVFCTKAVFGKGFRTYSPERSISAVAQAAAFGFRSFNLVDDAFTTDLDRARTFCEGLLRRKPDLPWTATNGVRVDAVDEAFFQLAARSGLRLVAFGFETGDASQLVSLGKNTSLRQAREAVAAARKAGIVTVGYFMLGLPGDTPRSMAETIAWATSLGLDLAKFSITLPLPGTPLHRQWSAHIHGPAEQLSMHRRQDSWFTHPDLPWAAIEAARRRAYREFYGRPSWAAAQVHRVLRRGWLFG